MTKKITRVIILFAIFAILLLPIFLMVSNSFTPVKAFMSRPPKFLPSALTLKNYHQALIMPYLPRWCLNTLIIVGVIVASGVIVNGTAGYVFAYARFRWLKPLFMIMLVPLFCTGYVMIIPRFVIVNQLKLPGIMAVIAMGIYWPMGIYLFRNYFGTVPQSFLENARLDGAKEYEIFWYIILPICKPIVGAAIVFLGMGVLGDWIWQLLNLTEISTQTFLVGLMASTLQEFIVDNIGYNLAVGTILFLPYMLIFAFSSRYFIKGLASGAIKG